MLPAVKSCTIEADGKAIVLFHRRFSWFWYNYYRNNNCSAADGVLYAGCNPNTKIEIINVKPTYDYCVYKTTLSDNSYYYSVVTFSHLNIPPFGTLFKTPVYGETRVYYNTSVEIEG